MRLGVVYSLEGDDLPSNGRKVLSILPTVAVNHLAFLVRVNDGAFAFPPFTGSETGAVIQFDCNGEGRAFFGLGRDLDGDDRLEGGEIGPVFGLSASRTGTGITDRNFYLQEAGFGSFYEANLNVSGVRGRNAGSDWYRIRLHVDFTANGGDGAGTLFYRNLTDGGPTFRVISELRDIPLGLHRLHADAHPSTWNSMWLHLLAAGGNSPRTDNLVPHLPAERPYRRGDANADQDTDISDAVFVLNYLFLGGAEPACLKSADANDSGGSAPDLSDPVYLLNFLFLGGPEPPAPFHDCGTDPTIDGDELSCESFPPCSGS
jgi:hypothetical protein